MGLLAARVGDTTSHGGVVVGPGNSTVLISGMPAATLGDTHICGLAPNVHQPNSSPFIEGSVSVFIGGKPALRVGDRTGCGATVVVGASTVLIG
ncbi:PAAR domain-containing protein [Algoriphagus sp.]|uniref:PAAR domain-containing protein n=1 Tax=Algoriphagus sp. TaxID=1872435 RepID=UPI0039199C6A